MNGHERVVASRGAIGLALVAVVLAGCSGEDLAERIAEEAIERESGGDVDIDIGDGDVRIQTEDGELSIETDDDGNVSIRGEGADGDFSVDSEDGVTVIESGDGETVISESGSGLPDDFPDEVPLPDGFTPRFSQSVSDGADSGWVLGGEIDGDPTATADAYIARLEGAGFTQVQVTRTPDGVIFGYENGVYQVNGLSAEGGDGVTFMNLTVTSVSG